MKQLTRITFNPEVMGGKPCIRGMRVTVGTVVGLMASGRTIPEILKAYPYLEEADIYEALSYAETKAGDRNTFDNLLSKPFQYLNPLEPVALDEWEVLQ
ncbi:MULTISPECIES: DUF433 domain-containing protein [Pseudanabaena]|uniref:DUF433 domain-containing protein n=1 Tax=Pseudanabaena biceps PCC 7429 TaxID=927668 RepID=L8N5S6_9CYAN|nr:DUF433 domain-containing protein [Pseudanabaena biceps]ELS33573.1 protein of unknown function DUF433 [Pseudanabaena biceps PCC 7429]